MELREYIHNYPGGPARILVIITQLEA